MTTTLERLLLSTLGMPCWQVRWDGQIGLDLNFGPPRLVVREPRAQRAGSPRVSAVFARRGVYLHGTHWLICQPGRWRLTVGKDPAVRDSSSSRRLDIAVARLQGEKLVAVGIHPVSGRTRFHFDLGSHLDVRRRNRAELAKDEELWAVTAHSRCAIVYGSGRFAIEPVAGPSARSKPLRAADWLVVASDPASRRRMLAALRRAAS